MENKSKRILHIIGAYNGMRFTDIQQELLYMTYPGRKLTRKLRGYWCTNLLGGRFYHHGLLKYYCEKGDDGLWRLVKSIPDHPWRNILFEKRDRR